MISLGLPNETIEPNMVFGDVLISVDDVTSVVTFVWGSADPYNNLPVLYSAISTVYDSEIFDDLERKYWLWECLIRKGQKNGHHSGFIQYTEKELFVVQALAFANIETLKGKTHDNQCKSTPAARLPIAS